MYEVKNDELWLEGKKLGTTDTIYVDGRQDIAGHIKQSRRKKISVARLPEGVGTRYLSPSCPRGIMSWLPPVDSPWASRRRSLPIWLALYEQDGYRDSSGDWRRQWMSLSWGYALWLEVASLLNGGNLGR